MRHRLAAPVALVAAVAVFAVVFLVTGSLIWSPLLALGSAVGLYLMLDDRTSARVDSDSYADDARGRVEEALRVVRGIERLARDVRRPEARQALEDACRYVPELFDRVKDRSPDSLYSTAAQIGGHLRSLDGVVRQYLDIQRQPVLYHDPQRLQRDGEQAFRRFADFALESVRLVNQGEIAQYTANLDTVAPPSLPDLGR
ncbi:5-bromo-4-chloroindolyl phosphate hydrolysis family protein [Micromonospora siamensis]|uniref:5-bromo-4-chloroindolyl phosphate hydrolysis protein n=1 Tax=Micromonospora siamensis TaxID=299152 RepID=A0A1C5H872_9ACTN|nr:5-bromo-4-chloroindolyl phosphate hydrolysis family protein [Micromonospora siamensis]SCG42204.1 5-bromo-4-chloroindolyl phosphate hydrolysis protein [Micromonospora siamensis]